MARNLTLLAAAVLIVVGVSSIWIPAGLIVAGVLTGAFVLLSE